MASRSQHCVPIWPARDNEHQTTCSGDKRLPLVQLAGHYNSVLQGLEDQLLGRVIVTEKQELEAEKVKLMEEVTQYKRKMKELEDNLLYKLTSTKVS